MSCQIARFLLFLFPFHRILQNKHFIFFVSVIVFHPVLFLIKKSFYSTKRVYSTEQKALM
jgi:hypothetical protein